MEAVRMATLLAPDKRAIRRLTSEWPTTDPECSLSIPIAIYFLAYGW
jgi:hypothetical protein